MRGANRRSALAATAALARVLGDSHFLGRWLLREPEWADDLAREPAPAPAPVPASADWPALRRAKYRGLLRIAARDRARPFDDGLAELSDLADGVLRRALALASGEREPPALFALGKLGGRELNFSSDVDLLFVCDAPPDDRGHAARESAAAVVRELKRRLDEPTDEGFAYRVDLDLRPEGPRRRARARRRGHARLLRAARRRVGAPDAPAAAPPRGLAAAPRARSSAGSSRSCTGARSIPA